MSKESFEHLSRLMDGELSRETGLFLTRRLASDEALCATWERYHLIRDCIRQPGSKVVVTGLREKLNESLIEEDSPRFSPWRSSGWLKPVSGVAIAASVAIMAIVFSTPQPDNLPGMATDTALTTNVNQPFVSTNTLPMVTVSQPVSYAPGGQGNPERLNAYLLRHNQMARTAGRQGFVSFVSIVATRSESVEDNSEEQPGSADKGPVQAAENNK